MGFQVFGNVYPGQYGRVLVHTVISRLELAVIPAPSLCAVGNFFTLKRYFHTREQAVEWASYLHKEYEKGPATNSLHSGRQLEFLF